MFNRLLAGVALAVMLLLPAVSSAQGNLLANPSFESDPALAGWTAFNNAYRDPANAHTGQYALKLFGNWAYAWNAAGAFQNLSAAGGQSFSLQGFGLNPSADPVLPGNQNFSLLKLVWFDGPNGTGSMLQPLPGPGAIFGDNPGIESQQLNGNTPLDTWQLLSAGGTAPAGTQSVQVLALFLQPNWEGGSLWFDDLTVTPEPASIALLGLGTCVLLRRRR